MAELLSSKSPVRRPGQDKCELRHVTAGNQSLLLPHASKFELSRTCPCHRTELAKQLQEVPDVAHFLTGQELLHMVGHFSSPSAATCVELLHRDNAVRWLAAAIEAFWNGARMEQTLPKQFIKATHSACT
jgi:hypothetical protein